MGRKPPSVAGFTVLTVGEAKGTAKLQKEHPIGHSRTSRGGSRDKLKTAGRHRIGVCFPPTLLV